MATSRWRMGYWPQVRCRSRDEPTEPVCRSQQPAQCSAAQHVAAACMLGSTLGPAGAGTLPGELGVCQATAACLLPSCSPPAERVLRRSSGGTYYSMTVPEGPRVEQLLRQAVTDLRAKAAQQAGAGATADVEAGPTAAAAASVATGPAVAAAAAAAPAQQAGGNDQRLAGAPGPAAVWASRPRGSSDGSDGVTPGGKAVHARTGLGLGRLRRQRLVASFAGLQQLAALLAGRNACSCAPACLRAGTPPTQDTSAGSAAAAQQAGGNDQRPAGAPGPAAVWASRPGGSSSGSEGAAPGGKAVHLRAGLGLGRLRRQRLVACFAGLQQLAALLPQSIVCSCGPGLPARRHLSTSRRCCGRAVRLEAATTAAVQQQCSLVCATCLPTCFLTC